MLEDYNLNDYRPGPNANLTRINRHCHPSRLVQKHSVEIVKKNLPLITGKDYEEVEYVDPLLQKINLMMRRIEKKSYQVNSLDFYLKLKREVDKVQ